MGKRRRERKRNGKERERITESSCKDGGVDKPSPQKYPTNVTLSFIIRHLTSSTVSDW